MQRPQLDAPFQLRPFQPDADFPLLMALLAAMEVVDQSGEVTTEAEQREQMTWPGHDLRQDRWVILSSDVPDILLGYADSWHMPGNSYADIYVGVHPTYRQRGFGATLLGCVLARAKQQGALSVGVYVDANHIDAIHFLESHGFRPQSGFVELYNALSNQPRPLELPKGYSVHPLTDGVDVRLLTELLSASYGDRFGHKIVGEDYVREILTRIPPEHWLLLEAPEQSSIGICRVRVTATDMDRAASGYLDAPGIIPAYRRPELYQLLAQAGLQLLHRHHVRDIVMESWGDDPEVIVRYCTLGFTIRRHLLGYQYMLP